MFDLRIGFIEAGLAKPIPRTLAITGVVAAALFAGQPDTMFVNGMPRPLAPFSKSPDASYVNYFLTVGVIGLAAYLLI